MKVPQVALQHVLKEAKGAWKKELCLTIANAFNVASNLIDLGLFDGDARAMENVNKLVKFTFGVMTERIQRVGSQVSQYPARAILTLDDDFDDRDADDRHQDGDDEDHDVADVAGRATPRPNHGRRPQARVPDGRRPAGHP